MPRKAPPTKPAKRKAPAPAKAKDETKKDYLTGAAEYSTRRIIRNRR